MNTEYIVYTYETANGTLVCHAYGPASQADAQAAGDKLKSVTVNVMVLPLEVLPA